MSVGVYFHCYAAGAWQTPTEEFLDAFIDSGLSEVAGNRLHVGLIGSYAERGAALRSIESRVKRTVVIGEDDEGWEQVTLEAMRLHPDGDHLLYCHTKGAAIVDEWQAAWRRSMYLCCVREWEQCVPWLEDYDAVGCHLLQPQPGMPQRYPFFGGNVFWVRRSYLERLETPAVTTRYDAEAWIGSGEGFRGKDIRQGWPGWGSIRQECKVPPPERVRL